LAKTNKKSTWLRLGVLGLPDLAEALGSVLSSTITTKKKKKKKCLTEYLSHRILIIFENSSHKTTIDQQRPREPSNRSLS
jgi:hypothetical protein